MHSNPLHDIRQTIFCSCLAFSTVYTESIPMKTMKNLRFCKKIIPICFALLAGFPSVSPASPKNGDISKKTSAILSKNNQSLTVFSHKPYSKEQNSIVFWKDNIPVSLNYVYDGAVLDRFPRNPKTDPDLGTCSASCVRLRLDFIPSSPLPSGPISFFSSDSDGPLIPLGRGTPEPSASNSSLWSVLLNPVPDLRATRTRTAFRSAPDGSSATESFVISVENASPDPKTVQVVEHALRGTNIQVVAAGQKSEIVRDGDKPPVILFPVRLSPESSKTVSYTVKYTW